MTPQALCEKLKIDERELQRWVAQGLPRSKVRGKWEYEERAVACWIRAQAEAKQASTQQAKQKEPEEIIARTWSECVQVLRELGLPVHERTLKQWRATHKDFPATPASTGQRNGRFPCREIVAWVNGNIAKLDDASGDVTGSPRSRQLIAKAELTELLVQEKRGQLIPREEAIAAVQRMFAMLDSFLEGIPDELASLLEPEFRGKGRERLVERVGKLRESLADQLEQEDQLRGGKLKTEPTENTKP
jgi:phage terminase Nu1 subunit (DNA packaging protein)